MRIVGPLPFAIALLHTNTVQGNPVDKSRADDTLLQASTVSLQLPLSKGIEIVNEAAQAASTSIELVVAWELGLETATAITTAAKERHFDSFGQYEDQIATINQAIPWGYLTFYAEGQSPHFELELKYWINLANQLADTQAKNFFELAALSYDNASFYGWSNIQNRTWDYGGCSPFGTGIHLNILTKIDAINESPAFASRVSSTIQRVRDLTLKDLLNGLPEFPYCNRGNTQQVTKMIEEGRSIIATVKLSEEERQALLQRVDANMGLSVD